MPQAQSLDRNEEGIALLIVLIALTLFSLMGLLSAMDAVTELRISDNCESHIRALQAARAGLNHARELLRGLPYDAQLEGADGGSDASPGYVASARTVAFRNPIPWLLARTLDLSDPDGGVAGMADDGILNTGSTGSAAGMTLIPRTGVIFGAGLAGDGVIARYFVKITDNNGEASEVAGDPSDDPFRDGDGVIIVRSLGVASTISEVVGAARNRNSVAAFESRLRLRRTFALDAPVVLQGRSVEPSGTGMFIGDQFLIEGGPDHAGIGVIDPDTLDGMLPAQDVTAGLETGQTGSVQGAGLIPSIRDLTPLIAAPGEGRLLLERSYLWNFINQEVPQFADAAFSGSQVWDAGSAPDLGYYNPAFPATDPLQRPRVTFVGGDLTLNGMIEGAGILVVTGRVTITGSFGFRGLILLVGAGRLEAEGWNPGLAGGLYMAALTDSGSSVDWANARISIAGPTRIAMNEEAIEMALRLIPPAQIGCREITPTVDP